VGYPPNDSSWQHGSVSEKKSTAAEESLDGCFK
jgi:hypothetical protein